MSCVSCSFSPCRCDKKFTVLSERTIDKTLVRSLTGCVDGIRDLYTCLGARAYSVSLLKTRWSSGDRGMGIEELISTKMILPTPLVSEVTALATEQLPIGNEEVGNVRVSQISPRFTEEELTGLEFDGCPIGDGENFYWEITFPKRTGDAVKRRFLPDAAPSYNPTAFEWEVVLVKASEDRLRVGDPRGG